MMSKTLTTEQFARLFERLGYHLVPSDSGNGPRVFENPEFDAVQFLPAAGKEPYARVEHLMTLRRIAVEKGIVDETTFEELLNEVHQQSSETLAKAS